MTKTSISQSDRQIAAISYLGLLFLVPMLMQHKSPFVKHHMKQGLVLFLAWFALFLANVVPFFGTMIWILGSVVIVIAMVLGVINALQGVTWNMPVLGKWAKDLKL